METFQKIVLVTAIVVLIVALTIIGIALKYPSEKQWPPVVSKCPDYWEMEGPSDAPLCINTKNLGNCPPVGGHDHLVMDFNTPAFSGENSSCAKYSWANRCNVSWDGITYGVDNPCN